MIIDTGEEVQLHVSRDGQITLTVGRYGIPSHAFALNVKQAMQLSSELGDASLKAHHYVNQPITPEFPALARQEAAKVAQPA